MAVIGGVSISTAVYMFDRRRAWCLCRGATCAAAAARALFATTVSLSESVLAGSRLSAEENEPRLAGEAKDGRGGTSSDFSSILDIERR